jgi:hypothetical protein
LPDEAALVEGYHSGEGDSDAPPGLMALHRAAPIPSTSARQNGNLPR